MGPKAVFSHWYEIVQCFSELSVFSDIECVTFRKHLKAHLFQYSFPTA